MDAFGDTSSFWTRLISRLDWSETKRFLTAAVAEIERRAGFSEAPLYWSQDSDRVSCGMFGWCGNNEKGWSVGNRSLILLTSVPGLVLQNLRSHCPLSVLADLRCRHDLRYPMGRRNCSLSWSTLGIPVVGAVVNCSLIWRALRRLLPNLFALFFESVE